MHVVATAGHVDHGKSMLVRALTGMEPDRWAEERRRGMTIDLGYAWMTLPSGAQIAFVDVPGHERFVSNMLAGVGPVPAVVFVVAADEGWMPQSAEHLAALDALGVRDGILVITRADLADPAPALRQAMLRIAGTSLHPMAAITVSALDGRGMPGLVTALDRLAGRLPRPDPRSSVRLWLDRVFAIKGSGTVVTGTLQAGTVRAGDELMLAPAMRPVRVRGVQSLGAAADQASGVARVALNLRGASAHELGRGMALVSPGRWTITSVIDVRVGPQRPGPPGRPGDQPLPRQLTLHIGAARTVAKVRILGPGTARLSLASPLPLHVGDRVLLRDPGAAPAHGQAVTAGPPIYGGTVLDVTPPRLRGSGAAAAAHRELASWPEPPVAANLLHRHDLLRAGTASAMGLHDLPPPVSGDWLADPAHWRQLRARLSAAVTAHHERDPLAAGLPLEAARAELGLPDRSLVEALAAGGTDGPVEVSGGYLRRARPLRTAQPSAEGLPAGVAAAVQAVLGDLADAPFRAPEAPRLSELGLDPRAAAAAERAGLLCRLPGNVILAAGATGEAARILARLPQPFTAAQARQALGTTRRVAIPLLEHLDRAGVTRRLADDRRMMREPPGSRDRMEDDGHAGRVDTDDLR
jgi:selenocysteine-specific elongation factor